MEGLTDVYVAKDIAMNIDKLETGLLLTALLGLAAHLYFKQYEPTSLLTLSFLLGVLPGLSIPILRPTVSSTLQAVLFAYATYWITLLSSIAIRRVSPLHPLSKFPGPFLCKLSKWRMVYITFGGKQHRYFKQLHDQYGPVVRIGPNELSIVDATLLPSILGVDGMPKGPLWDGRRLSGKGGIVKGNLIANRDKKEHAEARRVWNRAFTTRAVKQYEPIVIRRAAQLVEELKNRCELSSDGSAQVDLSEWLNFFSFDFMGDFVFGGPFELLREGDESGFLRTMDDGMIWPALTQHIPWIMEAVVHTPFVGKSMKGLVQFTYKQVTRRMKEGSAHNDLFYHLHDEERTESVPFGLMMSNAVTAIVAGSDTTSSALANIFFHILADEACYSRLRKEVDSVFAPGRGEPTDSAEVAKMEYLNAVVNETLRLHPPASTSLQRAPATGSGGHMLGNSLFIPEGTAVYSPPYVYHRDRRYFSPDPEKFRPERWLADNGPGAQNVLNMSAFIPFSTGPANCVGKPLAMLEMRMLLAYMMYAFDMHLLEGYDKQQWDRDLQDFFVLKKGVLPVVITPRVVT